MRAIRTVIYPGFSTDTVTETLTVRYVALLAFNKIVNSHAHLVSLHQDVIMSCIDDPDISIRLQALELGAGMVKRDSLVAVVERLMMQLRNAPSSVSNSPTRTVEIEPVADSEGEDPEELLQPQKENIDNSPALPTEYRIIIIRQILDMCSKSSYANISDFDWYLGTLVQLVGLVPSAGNYSTEPQDGRIYDVYDRRQSASEDVACAIGWELRNVAVRVSTVRVEAVNSAAALINSHEGGGSFTTTGAGAAGVLSFSAWVVGEFANSVRDLHETLNSLIHSRVRSLPDMTISAYLQAVPKVLVSIVTHDGLSWNMERKTMVTLLLARIVHFLEPLTAHPSLDVQERSVELVELMRVTAQAVSNHEDYCDHGPFLLTKVIPSLFTGSSLNPVAPTAQKKVPLPAELNLDTPLNRNLSNLLQLVNSGFSADSEHAEFEHFYNHRGGQKPDNKPALDMVPAAEQIALSYQQAELVATDFDLLGRKHKERRNKTKDDPFYIASDEFSSGTSTPFHEIFKNSNGRGLDVDSIPIMSLDLGEKGEEDNTFDVEAPKPKRNYSQAYIIADDETLDWDVPAEDQKDPGTRITVQDTGLRKRDRAKKPLLEVDSSGLGNYSIDDNRPRMGPLDLERQEAEDADMINALKEVERLRLEMQRASERTLVTGNIPPEGTLVRKRKKKKRNVIKGNKDSGPLIADSVNFEGAVS